MEKLSFIYLINNKDFQRECFQQQFTLDKENSIQKASHAYIFIDGSILKQIKIYNEIRKIVSENNVVMYTSDFDNLCIVTTGGIIIADKLPEYIRVTAAKKRSQRRKNIEELLVGYEGENFNLYQKNSDIIKELLNFQKDLLIGEKVKGNLETYQTLLSLLIESVTPILYSDSYPEKAKQFLKEYSN